MKVMANCSMFLSWVTPEPMHEILEKAGVPQSHLHEFDSFLQHVMISSHISRYHFLTHTLVHRLSWQVLGDFFREHQRRLQDDRRLYPVFDSTKKSDNPWNVRYLEWPNRHGVMGDSPFACTVSYYWVHDEDIIANYKPPTWWSRWKNLFTSSQKKRKSYLEKESLLSSK